MTDFSEKDMPGWKTQRMGQHQDWKSFLSKGKIEDCIRELKKHLRPTDNLLDVGCFTGHLYDYLGHKNYTGVDIYPASIREALARNPEANFICSDFRDLNGSWDIVWCCRVLIHNPDFAESVRKLKSLAKRMLFLVVATGDEDSISVDDYKGVRVYFRKFSEKTLRAMGECEIIKGYKYTTVIYQSNGSR